MRKFILMALAGTAIALAAPASRDAACRSAAASAPRRTMFRPRSRCIIAAGTTVTAIIIATVITTATAITIVDGFDTRSGRRTRAGRFVSASG